MGSPFRTNVRSGELADLVAEIVEGLGETGVTPMEGLTVAELVLWTLMENSFKLAPTEGLQEGAKIIAVRVLTRLSSRVEAWPAKPSERN